MNLKSEFYSKLPSDKIKINWNKNPIKMDLFLSFLTVEVTRSTNHLGDCNGWTLLKNDSLKLEIGGGIVGRIEYLESLQFGFKLSNPYNNYVNPFFLFEILNKEGQSFFIDYYKDEIEKIVASCQNEIINLKSKLDKETTLSKQLSDEIAMLQYNCH